MRRGAAIKKLLKIFLLISDMFFNMDEMATLAKTLKLCRKVCME